jgi:hypothetical protein
MVSTVAVLALKPRLSEPVSVHLLNWGLAKLPVCPDRPPLQAHCVYMAGLFVICATHGFHWAPGQASSFPFPGAQRLHRSFARDIFTVMVPLACGVRRVPNARQCLRCQNFPREREEHPWCARVNNTAKAASGATPVARWRVDHPRNPSHMHSIICCRDVNEAVVKIPIPNASEPMVGSVSHGDPQNAVPTHTTAK